MGNKLKGKGRERGILEREDKREEREREQEVKCVQELERQQLLFVYRPEIVVYFTTIFGNVQ